MTKFLRIALSLCFSLFLLLLQPAASSQAEDGVENSEILFGQSAAFDGPSAALGEGMRDGILAAFEEVNRDGGIHGRELRLHSYDDGYKPSMAIQNVNRLIIHDGIFALVGLVGTPTSKAVAPIAAEKDIPLIGPFTGAAFLRAPDQENVVNLRASYEQETESWIEHLTEDLGIKRVAVFYQDDSFGRAGLAGVREALARRGLEIVGEGRYMRNTTAVKRALLAIRDSDPEAIAMIGAYKANAAFIRLARDLGLNVIFMNISFVGSKALSAELDGDGRGVYVTQVVPFPDDRTIPVVDAYHKALTAYNPALDPGFVSLEGYLVGRFVAAVLAEIGPEPTREKFLSAVKSTRRFDIDGLELVFGPGDNQGLDRVFLTEITGDGSFRAIDRLTK
ncbi:ABC transporter substrate-binding protein [Sneathiella sp.]|uniref:ABC transporter substrate-binding protein n=1 Tax=Sneathiella sp. TaxID=1964365 RepID=UPI00262B02D9|nr:ABC transporter substrate-binding protein [Sneathiella sp.]MDF2368420.1 ABC transporter substrate-binding protein [Sneathiella sp.]